MWMSSAAWETGYNDGLHGKQYINPYGLLHYNWDEYLEGYLYGEAEKK